MSTQRIINPSNYPTERILDELYQMFGNKIHNKVRFEIDCGPCESRYLEIQHLDRIVRVNECYREEGADITAREALIMRFAKHLKEL